MPELPEVQTTVSGLSSVLPKLYIKDVWTEYNSSYFYGKDDIRDPRYFKYFKKEIIGKKILHVTRRAKNILINLGENTILIHMKMTGHLMYGDFNREDPFNRHIRLIFNLSNGKTLELCDSRKFAKITLIKTNLMFESKHLKNLGPEPLEKSFTFDTFKKQLNIKKNEKIKIVLLNQEIIAGIGNIYSDESLWKSDIHPKELVRDIGNERMLSLYKNIKKILTESISCGGDSMSDYRNIHGEKGKFQEKHMAYRKTNTKCLKKNCKGKIVRIVVGNRGTHICNIHQKLSSKTI